MPLVDERWQCWHGGRHDLCAGSCLRELLCAIRRCHLLLVAGIDAGSDSESQLRRAARLYGARINMAFVKAILTMELPKRHATSLYVPEELWREWFQVRSESVRDELAVWNCEQNFVHLPSPFVAAPR